MSFFVFIESLKNNSLMYFENIHFFGTVMAGDTSAKSIYFGSYYRPNISDMENIDELNTSLLKMGSTSHKNNVILAGDFNAPDVDWNKPLNQDNLTTASKELLQVFDDHDLNQLVKEPTR